MTNYLTDLTLDLAAITKVGADIAITMWEMQTTVAVRQLPMGLSLHMLEQHLEMVEKLHDAIQANDEDDTRQAAIRILAEIQGIRASHRSEDESTLPVNALDTAKRVVYPLEKAEKAVTNVLTKLSQGKGPNK